MSSQQCASLKAQFKAVIKKQVSTINDSTLSSDNSDDRWNT